MNPLAQDLNDKITAVNPIAYELLSSLGKRIYFPSKGILSQAGEAKKLATRFNATIGTALEGGKAMHLQSVMDSLPGLSPNEALLYAPSYGNPALRKAWLAKDLHDNPALEGVGMSLPVVANGLSHSLSLVADLFIDEGDDVLLPDMNWDNYYLNFVERRGANFTYFNFFADGGFDIKSFESALAKWNKGQKLLTILNFPNNPSGYTPTESEGQQIADALLRTADRGVNLVVLVDDAYFGLFFKDDVMKQSLFTKIAGKRNNLMALKADAATKEVYVWGLRVGFLTFSIGGAESGSPLYTALEAKTAGLVRSIVSNCSALSQNIVAKALTNPDFYTQRSDKAAIMQTRALEVEEVLANADYNDEFTPYPFNSGYFMCLKIKKHNADTLRRHLLNNYGIGTIAITDTNLRVAFSCLEHGQMAELFAAIYQACKDLSAGVQNP